MEVYHQRYEHERERKLVYPILLDGGLTARRLTEAWREAERYFEEPRGGPLALVLVLNSEGGDTVATREFMKRFMESDCTLSAKIYRAESAAAFIALSTAHREIVRDGVFRIHLGGRYIESNMLVTPKRVSDPIVEEAERWRTDVLALLEQCGFPKEGEPWTRLLAHNELALTPARCAELGLVHKII